MGVKIGIIVPSQNLVKDYKNILAKLQFISLLDIEVGTPNDFLGIEKDAIIISHLRNSSAKKWDFDLKSLNLALTRAKKFVWFIGKLESVAMASRYFLNLGKYVNMQ